MRRRGSSSHLYMINICIVFFLTHQCVEARISRQHFFKASSHHNSKLKQLKHIDMDYTPPLNVLPNAQSYGVGSPFNLPPFDSLAPTPQPQQNPFCDDSPPGHTPLPPSTTAPPTTAYTPPPPFYLSPLLPYQSPPFNIPSPPFNIPSPPETSPMTPIPPVSFPSPPETSPMTPIPPVSFPSPPESSPTTPTPPESNPSPPGGSPTPTLTPPEYSSPSPPNIIQNPPVYVPSPFVYVPTPPSGNEPSPPVYAPGPPDYEPSPPGYDLSPPMYVPSPYAYVPGPPSGGYVPNPPSGGYVPNPPSGGGGFVPSPPVFQPPDVFPPPSVPPSPFHKGQGLVLWCVAKPSVPDPIIEEAMNYACGSGAECGSIQPQGSCYRPETLYAHASYAFNSYWQRTKAAGGTCDFGGTAILVTIDPSFDGCHFIAT